MAAVVVLVGLALPPARLTPVTGTGDDSVPGVFHVHTNRSDGLSSPETIAAIAATAGLKFVVFTDHGDATRQPDPPTYRSGVLCIDAVEISTQEGHLIALGLAKAPYPLAGEGRDVLEDVHRLGGTGIAAHPDSPRPQLQWREWDAPLDGLELLNLDSEWRARAAEPGWRTPLRMARALATYLVRPSETIASLIGGSRGLDDRWLALAATRRVPIFAGVDAHARLDLTGGDAGESRWTLALPGYEAIFRTLSMRVRPSSPLTGDAARDGALILDALRAGHGYAVLDAVMSPPAFAFTASAGGSSVAQGDEIEAAGPVTLTVSTNAPAWFTTIIWRAGEVLYSEPSSPEVTVTAPPGPAVYRAEVRAARHADAPAWILSNAIAVRAAPMVSVAPTAAPPPTSGAAAPRVETRALFDRSSSTRWTAESSAAARIAFDDGGSPVDRELAVRFGLPGGDVFGEYVALAGTVDGGMAGHQRLTFRARSDKPMRLSVQLRVPDGPGGGRWHRSVYLDADPREYDLAFGDFRGVGITPTAQAPLTNVQDILFVVDQTNTKPGTSGRVWLSNITLR